MPSISSVDEYIENTPIEYQEKVKQLRSIIKKTAPKAQERISYGIPYYGYYGRLAYFRLSKKHLGLYIPPPIIHEHKKELKGYRTATSTIQFPLERKLPEALIIKLIKARIKKNEETKMNK